MQRLIDTIQMSLCSTPNVKQQAEKLLEKALLWQAYS